ncbi:MAG: alpha/beta hydrolase-fold protein [Reichenbachiella sp.]|uniref:alpha/beta hydrolase n=1 Tax=Reichenbachiella sp. TaxID=2184521 RepID=UPI0032662446
MMKLNFPLLCLLLTLGSLSSKGQGRVVFTKIEGTAIEIYTPPEFNTDRSYPVVYFNDGQMLFGHKAVSMALQQTLDSLIENEIIDDLMVVGISADRLRSEKYVPYPNDAFQRAPNGDSYAQIYSRYLLDTVIPYIDSSYNTVTQASGRAIFGFSFGGLNALWMTLNYPDVFGMAGGFSPSMWVNDFAIFNEADKYQSGQKIWFDIGTAEWNYYVPFQKLLRDHGAMINSDVYYSEVPLGLHAMLDWKQRIAMPFIVFAGENSNEIMKMEVEIEVIPSQSIPGKKYTRLNPIVTCRSGLVYSLAYEATYEVLNPIAGKVYEEGRFELFGEENMDVLVSYREFSKKVKIRSRLLEE